MQAFEYADMLVARLRRFSCSIRWVCPVDVLEVVLINKVTKRRGGGDICDVVWRSMLVHKQANIRRHDS